MTISNELSSEIATALLAAKNRTPRELEDLKEILLTIHSTLQRLTEEYGATRIESQPVVKVVKKVAAVAEHKRASDRLL
ncbi:MAG TPA: hypothetical protein VMZ30_12365 [Pyrinomonadaceae bacterium]|nr:hypothetical protein [Pyrinomonadaceae bacterium]